jgi:hypothetical protein
MRRRVMSHRRTQGTPSPVLSLRRWTAEPAQSLQPQPPKVPHASPPPPTHRFRLVRLRPTHACETLGSDCAVRGRLVMILPLPPWRPTRPPRPRSCLRIGLAGTCSPQHARAADAPPVLQPSDAASTMFLSGAMRANDSSGPGADCNNPPMTPAYATSHLGRKGAGTRGMPHQFAGLGANRCCSQCWNRLMNPLPAFSAAQGASSLRVRVCRGR